jgi:hypothetical protein
VQVVVDGDGVLAASTYLRARSDEVRRLATRCDDVADGLRDHVLRAGAHALADVVADALDLVATDLGLLASKVREGALLYDRVERGLRDGTPVA